MSKIWPRIERLMHVGGMTWKQAADALGCSTAAMAQWKTGKTGPSKRTIFRLEEAERAVGIEPPPRIQPTALDRLAERIEARGEMGVPLAKLHGKDPELDDALAAATPEVKAIIKRLSEFAASFQEELRGMKSEMKTMRELLESKNNQKRGKK
jgi:transcriptional regulator with XRE-family HTH domain